VKGALDIHRALLARDVPHEILRLPRVVLSADEVPDVLGLPRTHCVAVRMYEADDALVAVVVRAGDVPHPMTVLGATGARTLRPAPADRVNRDTDYAASLVSPLLLPSDVQVLADSCLSEIDVVYAPTGEGGTVLGIPLASLLVASAARVDEFCGPVSDLDEGDEELLADMLSQPAHGWR
jgi:Cys-tRNA(Pro)/Cys-tRNA(Cys) deacylase